MKAYVVILLFIIGSRCNAQKQSDSIAASQFLEWFATQLEEPSIAEESANLDKGMLSKVKGLKVSLEDSISMLSQIEKRRLRFSNSQFPNKKILSEAEVKAQFQKGTYLFVRISRPIFASDKVWIYSEHFCGDNCGFGEIKLYQKKGAAYKLIERVQIWIS